MYYYSISLLPYGIIYLCFDYDYDRVYNLMEIGLWFMSSLVWGEIYKDANLMPGLT